MRSQSPTAEDPSTPAAAVPGFAASPPSDFASALDSTYARALTWLCLRASPRAFLRLLPADGALRAYWPWMEACARRAEGEVLHEEMVQRLQRTSAMSRHA